MSTVIADRDDAVDDDQIVVLSGASWRDYRRLLRMRGDHSAPRISYLEGEIEILSPSKKHESIKSRIGCLVDLWCAACGTEFEKIGSWTLASAEADGGIEPDECYAFGDSDPAAPDLAIEVVWRSGGVRKLDIYRKLGVREVWVWCRAKLSAHILDANGYRESGESAVLPGIDLKLLARCLDEPTTSASIRAWRVALRMH